MLWKQSPALAYAVFLAVRCMICLVQILSYSTARSLVAMIAWLAFIVDRRHRLVALDNLRKAFPNRYTERALHAVVLASYRHFLTLLVEISLLPRKMHRSNAKYYFDLGPRQRELLELVKSPRPVLIVTAHFGNWEFAGYGLGVRGIATSAVARPLDNPYLDSLLRRFREHMGQTILAKNDVRALKAALDQGGKIAVLADQSAGPCGLMVDFFGRSASTNKGIAVLAMQHLAPMVVVGVRKVAEPMRYRADVQDIIYPEDYQGSRAEVVRSITQRYTAGLERAIRAAPEQYLWLHNRWKQYPDAAAALARAA